MKKRMLEYFEKAFGDNEGVEVFFAPGRVNLIGEHTDYNGGHVFPCALTIGTYGAVRKRTDRKLRFYSMNFEDKGIIECSLDKIVYDKSNNWTNYCLGVLWAFKEKGFGELDCGFDFCCYGNIPNGSGLSSSASLEVLIAKIVIDMYGKPATMVDAALISQLAENGFIGLNCGIMDQFVIAMGKKDCAIFLDTATLEYTYVPIKLSGMKIVIGNTNKKRGLTDSKYNERRAECESALAKLQKRADIKALGELTCEQFDEISDAIDNETERRRAKHAVYENIRTIEAVDTLRAGRIEKFGELMNASHESLDKDYEVTGIELDTLVEAAWKQKGVIGARMTGAGFGGCTVSIVMSNQVENFVNKVGSEYKRKIGYEASFYVVEIGDGPQRL